MTYAKHWQVNQMPFNNTHIEENGVTWLGAKVQEEHFRVEFTNRETGKQFKKICFTNEQLVYFTYFHATAKPGDDYYNCEMKIIHCVPKDGTEIQRDSA